MEKEDYRKIMLQYDYLNKSVKSFCKLYPYSERFVFKHLKEWNIPRKTKDTQVLIPRNKFGQFTLKHISSSKTTFLVKLIILLMRI